MATSFRKLGATDRALAKTTFATMASVFDEPYEILTDDYLDTLLRRTDFWAVAALESDIVIGGITAHTIPMTRAQTSELFIYDIAVRAESRRRGVGRGLIAQLRACAADGGVHFAFVPVDNEDEDALDFYRALDAGAQPVTIFNFLR